MDIWLYWQNPPQRETLPYIKMCQETIQKKVSGNIHLLDDQSIKEYIEILPVQHLSLNQRSDYYRGKLLLKYGGIYLDSDTVMLRDIVPSFAPLIEEYGYVEAGFACLGAKAGNPLVERWVEANERLIRQKKRCSFSELGGDCINTLKKSYQGSYYDFRSKDRIERFIPLEFTDWWFFFQDRELALLNDPEQVAVVLFNAYMGKFLAQAPRELVLGSQTLLGRVFRKALSGE